MKTIRNLLKKDGIFANALTAKAISHNDLFNLDGEFFNARSFDTYVLDSDFKKIDNYNSVENALYYLSDKKDAHYIFVDILDSIGNTKGFIASTVNMEDSIKAAKDQYFTSKKMELLEKLIAVK